jgi:hypothetical protein
MGAALMAQRPTLPTDPAAALKAAKATAATKAERAPHTLTEAEVGLLPGKKILQLGNSGRLRHLGLGTAPLKPSTPVITPKGSAQRGTRKTGNARARQGRK